MPTITERCWKYHILTYGVFTILNDYVEPISYADMSTCRYDYVNIMYFPD